MRACVRCELAIDAARMAQSTPTESVPGGTRQNVVIWPGRKTLSHNGQRWPKRTAAPSA
jgi:hypothetical protein